MTDNQLATLSTLIWLVLTSILFVELANWSAGGSWTIVPGLLRGARGWATRGQEPDLPAFAISAGEPTRGAPAAAPEPLAAVPDVRAIRVPAEPTWYDLDPGAEIEELDHSEL